jgi:hypothetical protein
VNTDVEVVIAADVASVVYVVWALLMHAASRNVTVVDVDVEVMNPRAVTRMSSPGDHP